MLIRILSLPWKVTLCPDEEVGFLNDDLKFNEIIGLHQIPVGSFFIHLNASSIFPAAESHGPLAVDEYANLWPGCRSTWALGQMPRALPVGLHILKHYNTQVHFDFN